METMLLSESRCRENFDLPKIKNSIFLKMDPDIGALLRRLQHASREATAATRKLNRAHEKILDLRNVCTLPWMMPPANDARAGEMARNANKLCELYEAVKITSEQEELFSFTWIPYHTVSLKPAWTLLI